jgi:hypothetical protein
VARSRLGDCGVMRNLPVDPSTVNPKTLVQLKKIHRGKIRSRADQDHFRTRASAAALRGNFRAGDRRSHRIVVLRAAYFPQAAHRKCRKSSRPFLVFDRHSDPHSDQRSAVLKIFAGARPRNRLPKSGAAEASVRVPPVARRHVLPAAISGRLLGWRREFFLRRAGFSAIRRGRRTGLPLRVFDRVSGRLTRAHACRTSGFRSAC